MRPHGLEGNALFVLADDCQSDAPAGEGGETVLKLDEGLALGIMASEAQPLPSDVAHHAAPERLVEVENDELARTTQRATKRSFEIVRGLGEYVARERHLAQVPALGVHRTSARGGHPPLRIEHEDVGVLREPLGQPKVHAQERIGHSIRPELEHPVPSRKGRLAEGGHEPDTGEIGLIADEAGEGIDLGEDGVDRFSMAQEEAPKGR